MSLSSGTPGRCVRVCRIGTYHLLVDQIVAAGKRILDRPEAIDLALFERDQHARGRHIAGDDLDRITLRAEQRRHHGGRRRRAERAEDQRPGRRFQRCEVMDAGRGAHVKRGIHPAGAADIAELVDVERHARTSERAFDVPGAARHRDGQPVGGDAPRRDNSLPRGPRRLPCSAPQAPAAPGMKRTRCRPPPARWCRRRRPAQSPRSRSASCRLEIGGTRTERATREQRSRRQPA